MKARKIVMVTIAFFMLLASCTGNNEVVIKDSQTVFGIFKVLQDGKTAEMNGTINSSSLVNFNKLFQKNPKVTKINIKQCDGSSDDEVNLLVSKRVYDLNIEIHLLNNAEIASGGVDFFLAGKRRTRGSGTKIGVHSWSNGQNEATDFPVGHANHLPYINYYKSIGFTDEEAKAFYYFTINAAAAKDIHWMTEEEIVKYKMLKS